MCFGMGLNLALRGHRQSASSPPGPVYSPEITQCIANLQTLAAGVRAYRVVNGAYPVALFGIAPGGGTMADSAAGYAADPAGAPGLYPTYIDDLDVFHCPAHTGVGTPSDPLEALAAKVVDPYGYIDIVAFYTYSSYEANYAIIPETLAQDETTYKCRYSRLHMQLPEYAPESASDPEYPRQLYFHATARADAVVSMCTCHADSEGKIVVGYLDGRVGVYDTAVLLGYPAEGESFQDFQFFRMDPDALA